MDEKYDIIVLGTGLKECILSGLMSSVANKKVLHLDRNSYYGGESASLNLEQLFKKFRPDEEPPKTLGKSRDYSVDLCPKFLLACGNLVKILLKTKVTAYLEFRSVAGSFVYQEKLGKIAKVPSTPKEALSSSLLPMMQKNKFRKFITWVGEFDASDPKYCKQIDVNKMTAEDFYKKFSLEAGAINFSGHAIALYRDDEYLKKPAIELVERCQLYANSVARYGQSPYIYPKWGLGGLPEGFSRRCAVHGGVYMLNSEEKKNFIEKIHYNDKGKVTGVQVGGEVATCNLVIGDPTYWLTTDEEKKKLGELGSIVRAICILDHPIENTSKADSCQIIIPHSECKEKKSDIYICMSSFQHNIAAQGKYIAVCSTAVEIDAENPEKDLELAFNIIGEIEEQFIWVSECYQSKDGRDPSKDGCYITSSYDATTHFETCCTEVLEMYEAIIGEPLDLSVLPDEDET